MANLIGERADSTRKSNRNAALLVGLFMLGALALRLWGADFMLPYRIIQDEGVFITHVELMRGEPPTEQDDVWKGRYPELVPYIDRLLWPETPRRLVDGAQSLEGHLAVASRDALRLRLIVIFLSTLLVPGTFLLARRFMGTGPSLLATGLVSADVLHVLLAQQARPHGSAVALSLWAVLASMWVYRRGSWPAYALAGIAHGLAIGSVQYGLAALPSLVVAHWLRSQPRSWSRHLRLVLSLAILVGAVRLFYPFMFGQGTRAVLALGPTETSVADPARYRFLGEVDLSTLSPGLGFPVLVRAAWHYQPLVFCLTLLGLAWRAIEARGRRRLVATAGGRLSDRFRARLAGHEDLVIVLAYVIPFVAMFSIYRAVKVHYVLPLLPYLACMAAWSAYRLAESIVRAKARRAWSVHGVAWTVFVLQAALAIRITSIRAAPDTQAQAADWIRRHLRPETNRIAMFSTLDLPLIRQQTSLSANYEAADLGVHPWFKYQSGLTADTLAGERYDLTTMDTSGRRPESLAKLWRDPIAFVRDHEADYVVVEVYDPTFHRRGLTKALEGVRAQGKLVARFSPLADDDGTDAMYLARDLLDETPRRHWWTANTLHFARLGQLVEIYELR